MFPSRCHVLYTASSRDSSSSLRWASRSDFKQITGTRPISSSSEMNTVPFAVSGCGRWVTMPQIPDDSTVGHGLGLADEVDREEPGRQWQLGVLHQAACGKQSALQI